MGRLIDADKLENYVLKEMHILASRDLFLMLDAIKKQPTVDAAPVVRCKCCVKSSVTEMGKRFCNEPFGSLGSIPVKDDDFCNRGKEIMGCENDN
jgi:hypothetical protein